MNFPLTNFTFNHPETDKSDKTDNVSNVEFLGAVFHDDTHESHPMLVSFVGSPNVGPASKWYGKRWLGDNTAIALSGEANNYFSLARYKPNAQGEYRRQKVQFVGLYAVMLDDIGTKVPIERLTITPSWLIETSAGNYQVGYILSEPLCDIKKAAQMMDAIIRAGLCDPGAHGPATRLARLPIGVNGKHNPIFTCQLKCWSPENRYTLQQLIDGLQLELTEKDRAKRKRAGSTEVCDIENDPVWIPRPSENAVLVNLRDRNLYKTPLGTGKHDITCPWIDEHTDRVDSGTAYFEPDDNWPIGGFKCLHGHCAERHIRDLLRILDIDASLARMKPTIRVVKGEIHRIVDAAEHELANTQQYYQRGGLIVCVFTDPSTKETRIQDVSQPALVRALACVATWVQFDARSNGLVRIDPPARHVGILYDANIYRHLPALHGLSRQPYLRPDGSLVSAAGYDSNTEIFGVFDARKYVIHDMPSRKDAELALKVLHELLDEFSFASETDRSATLAAILTASIRPTLSRAPMFHVRAHTAGSGKSYLCELITAFATPQGGTPTTFPTDDDECRKLIFAELLRAPAVIEFDNLTADILPHKSLCTALTSEFMNSRILGISKTATVSTRALFLSSGNNVGPIKDMTRRCITINLNPEVEIPASRTYGRPNLISEIMQERERYVSAALTIIRAWIVVNRPQTHCKSLASYNEWSDICRQPLLWLGCSDPAASIFEAIVDDPDRELLARLLIAWQTIFGKGASMIRDAISEAYKCGTNNNELKEILHDIADERGTINRRKLGWWIKRHAGQIVDGLRFIRCSGNSSAEKWRVESVSAVSSLLHDAHVENVITAKAYRQASSGE